jgi:hypothetical protein
MHGQRSDLVDTPQLLALAAAHRLGQRRAALPAAVLLTGLAGWTSAGCSCRPACRCSQHPGVLIAASGFMLFTEFFADKIPGLDSLWDMRCTPRSAFRPARRSPPAHFGADHARRWRSIAALLGGGLAATSARGQDATTRAAVNTSPEPFSERRPLSLAEDTPGAVFRPVAGRATHPLAFAIVLVVSIVLAVILLVVLIRFLRTVVRGLGEFFRGRPLPRELG